LNWRDSSALGVLMNTRGLMELIVLNIGLELHVISPTLFAMLVIMALATTLATSPILQLIMPRHQLEAEASRMEEDSRFAEAMNERSGTLIPVSSTTAVAGLLEIALSLTPADAPPPRVLALNRSRVTGVGPKIIEAETFSPSRSPVLAAALDAAWSRGIAIKPEAVWTADAAGEIVDAAERTNVRWVLLDSGRSIFGQHPRRSIVKKVMQQVAARPLNVAVLVQSSILRPHPLTCIVHGPKDGHPALELATSISRSWEEAMQVLVFMPAPEATDNLEGSSTEWLNSLPASPRVVVVSEEKTLVEQVNGGLVVIANDVLDALRLSIGELANKGNVIVVQGGGKIAVRPASEPINVGALSTSAI
jgi:hypothetical protein